MDIRRYILLSGTGILVLVGRLKTIQPAGPNTMATIQLPPPPSTFQQKLRVGDPGRFSEIFCSVSRRYAEGYHTVDTEITSGYPCTPGYPDPNTRRVMRITRTRTGRDRSGYYPPGTRVVDERGTNLRYTLFIFFIFFSFISGSLKRGNHHPGTTGRDEASESPW